MFVVGAVSYARGVPTAAQYREAAQRYRAIAEHLSREAGAVRAWVPGFVSAGIVADDIEASNERAANRLATAGDDLVRIARICDGRAEVCARYADAVWRFYQMSFDEQLQHGYPARPATWADV